MAKIFSEYIVLGDNVLDDADIFDDEFYNDGKPRTKKKAVKTSESIEWAKQCGIRENYTPGKLEAGYKVPIFLTILKKSAEKGEKVICFSQSLGKRLIKNTYMYRLQKKGFNLSKRSILSDEKKFPNFFWMNLNPKPQNVSSTWIFFLG